MTTTVTSSPPTVITTGGHERDDELDKDNDDGQEGETYDSHGGDGRDGAGCTHGTALPRPGAGHLAELRQVRDDAQRPRDGLPRGRAVLRRAGQADRRRRHRRHAEPDGMHPDDLRRLGTREAQVRPRAGQRTRLYGRKRHPGGFLRLLHGRRGLHREPLRRPRQGDRR
ncbi:MAG: hypothetical protein IKX22_03140 [Prevotella sp.]|nr:hypothetical protein [Prevotella sp.]